MEAARALCMHIYAMGMQDHDDRRGALQACEAFLATTLPILRSQVRADKVDHMKGLTDRMNECAASNQTAHEWKWLRRIMRYGGRKCKFRGNGLLPFQHAPDGQVVTSQQQ